MPDGTILLQSNPAFSLSSPRQDTLPGYASSPYSCRFSSPLADIVSSSIIILFTVSPLPAKGPSPHNVRRRIFRWCSMSSDPPRRLVDRVPDTRCRCFCAPHRFSRSFSHPCPLCGCQAWAWHGGRTCCLRRLFSSAVPPDPANPVRDESGAPSNGSRLCQRRRPPIVCIFLNLVRHVATHSFYPSNAAPFRLPKR